MVGDTPAPPAMAAASVTTGRCSMGLLTLRFRRESAQLNGNNRARDNGPWRTCRVLMLVIAQAFRGVGIAIVAAAGIRYFQDLLAPATGRATTCPAWRSNTSATARLSCSAE